MQNIHASCMKISILALFLIASFCSAKPINYESECTELGFSNLVIKIESAEGLQNAGRVRDEKQGLHTETFTNVLLTGTINNFKFETGIFNTRVVFANCRAEQSRFTGNPSIIVTGNDKLHKCVSQSAGLLAMIVKDYINGHPLT